MERAHLNLPGLSKAKADAHTFVNENLEGLHNNEGPSIEDVRESLLRGHGLDKKAVQDVLSQIEARKGVDTSSQDVGSSLRAEVVSHLKKAWKKRKQETEPLWDIVAKQEGPISPDMTRAKVLETIKLGIDQPAAISHYARLKETVGKGKKDLGPLDDIDPNKLDLSSESPFLSPSIIWKNSTNEQKIDILKRNGLIREADTVRISALDAERKRIRRAAKDAENSGDHSLHRYLNELEQEIREDLFKNSPEAELAVKKYAEFSPPINKIENVTANAQMIKKKFGEPQALDTTIGESFTKGKNAPENIQNLNEAFETRGELGNVHKEAIKEAITSHAAHDLMEKVVNPDGLVNLNALKQYRSRMTGVQEVNPEFVEDLKALAVAQSHLENQFGRSKGGAKSVLTDGDSPRIIHEILSSTNKQKALNEVLEMVRRVGMNDGREGLMNGVLDHMQQTIRGRAGSHTITPHAFKSYIKKYGDILSQFLDADQMKILKGIDKIMSHKQHANVAGKVPGSDTKTNISLGQDLISERGRNLVTKLLHSLVSSNKYSKEFLKNINISKEVKDVKLGMLDEFLTNPQQALKDLRDSKIIPHKSNLFAYSKHSIPRNIINDLLVGDSNNKE
jgi:hypothetical protein